MSPGDLAAFNNLTDDLSTIIIVLIGVMGPVWLMIHYMKYKSAGSSTRTKPRCCNR